MRPTSPAAPSCGGICRGAWWCSAKRMPRVGLGISIGCRGPFDRDAEARFWGMSHIPARSAIQAATSEASHPVHPDDIRRRRGNSLTRSRRQRVDRLRPVIWRHSGSRMMRSAMCIGEASISSPRRVVERAARRACRFGLSMVSVSMCVSRQCTTHQT